MKIRKEHAEEALLIQNAVNLSGVVHSFSRIIKEIWEDYHKETRGHGSFIFPYHPNTHPVSVLFASKIYDLATCGSEHICSEAYDLCKQAKDNEADFLEVK